MSKIISYKNAVPQSSQQTPQELKTKLRKQEYLSQKQKKSSRFVLSKIKMLNYKVATKKANIEKN